MSSPNILCVSGEVSLAGTSAEPGTREERLQPGPGLHGSESDHDRSSDRSDDLSSRESSADQVLHIFPDILMQIFLFQTKYFISCDRSRQAISVIK